MSIFKKNFQSLVNCFAAPVMAVVFIAFGPLFAADDYSTWLNWRYVYLITNSNGANVTNTVTNFPVLIRLNPGNFDDLQNTNDNGSDIRFSTEDGTHLYYSIERWTHTSSTIDTAEIWVLVPTVTGNDTTVLKMYWNNPSAVDSSKSTMVFDTANGFAGVYHMKQASGSATDATISALNGTANGGVTYSQAGIIGYAGGFDGNGDYFDMGNNARFQMDAADKVTVSAWVYRSGSATAGDEDGIVGKFEWSAGNYREYCLINKNTTSKFNFEISSNGTAETDLAATTTTANSTWYYVTGTMDASAGTKQIIYVNGAQENSSNTQTAIYGSTNSTCKIGLMDDNGSTIRQYWNGKIDEVRVERVARSADWIKLCYQNQRQTGNRDSLTWFSSSYSTSLSYTWDSSTIAGIQPAKSGTWGTNSYWTTTGTSLYAWPGPGNGAVFGGSDGNYTITVSGTQYVDSITFSNSGYKITGGTSLYAAKNLSGSVFGFTPPYAAGTDSAKAFDGSTSTYCDNSSASGGYTGIDLGSGNAQQIAYIRYYPRSGFLSRMTGGKFQGSNDGSSYTDLYTVPSDPTLAWQTVAVTNTTAWRYLRYLGPTNGYCNIAEAEFYGMGSIYVASGKYDTIATVLAGNSGVTKYGSGSLTLAGANTYSGATSITAGTLRNGAAGVIPDGSAVSLQNVASTTYDLNGNAETVGSIAGGGTTGGNITLGSATLTCGGDGTNTTYSGAIGGTGGLTKAGSGTLTLSGANTYTGITTINAGTVSISSLADGGTSCNLGAAPAAAANLVLNGGTLLYTGGAQNCNRLFTLGTGGGTITSSGSGALNLTGTTAWTISGSGARTLTLNGTQTGDNTLAAVIGDNGGGTAIIKSGAGRWILSATNTYTGATTISGGTLVITGSIASAVTVQSGGTLAGTGSNSSTVSVQNNGTLSPGTTGTGILTVGGLTLASGAKLAININGATTAGTDYDQVAVNGTVDLASATLLLTLNYAPTAGDVLTIITNDGSDAVTNTFSGLSEGSNKTATYGGATYNFTVSYTGGTGNDVVLTAAGAGTWNYSRSIFLNTTPSGANVATNQVNFPVLVRLSSSNFDFSQAQDSGQDLRFYKPTGMPFSYQIEQWDRVNQTAAVWVRADTVFGNNGTQYFTMYWGNSSASSMSNSAGVFDTANSFRAVWHFNETSTGGPAAGVFKDATSNGNNGDDSVSATGKTGIIGLGQQFNGSGDYIPTHKWVTTLGKGNFTASLWVYLSGNGGALFFKGTGGSWSSGEKEFYFGDGTTNGNVNGRYPSFVGYSCNNAISGTQVGTGAWHYLTFAWNYNGGGVATRTYYIDGASVALSTSTLTGGVNDLAGSSISIGHQNYSESQANFSGYMDELRIDTTVRSSDWIKLCYENQKPDQDLVDLDDYSKWKYSKNIIVKTGASNANTSTKVAKFPYLVRLSNSNFNFSQAQPTGLDLRFSRADGTHFPYQIERWNNSASVDSAEMWVKIDTVYPQNDSQYFTMYWGNPNATADTCGPCVFDTGNGFVGVWHFNETSGNAIDATANANNGTTHSGVHYSKGSLIGPSDSLDGTTNNGYFDMGTDPSFNMSTNKKFTVSAWVNHSSAAMGADEGIAGRWNWGAGSTYREFILEGVSAKAQLKISTDGSDGGATAVTTPASSISNGTWYYLTGVMDGTNMTVYINDGTTNSSAGKTAINYASAGNTVVGAMSPGTAGQLWNGKIDEVRIEKTNRSTDWIKLCYYSQVPASTITVRGDSSDQFLPLSIKRYGSLDSVAVWTSRWGIKFKNNKGGGIGFLGPDTVATHNQLDSTLFTVLYNGARSDTNASQSALSMIDSSLVFARVRQAKTISGQPFTIDYTVLGSGRMYARATTYNATGSAIGTGLEFRVANNSTGKYRNIQYGSNVTTCQAIMHVDSLTGKYNLLMAPYDLWGQADQITTNTRYAGIKGSAWTLAPYSRQSWNFMIDFSHKSNNDSATAWKYINDYRSSDALEWYAGTPLLQKAWEDKLFGHWKLDERNGDTASDVSVSVNDSLGNFGIIYGHGNWTAGKWNNGDNLDGTDSIIVKPASPALFNGAYSGRGFTILGWVKPASTLSASSVLFSQMTGNSGYQLTGASGGYLQLTLGNGASTVSLVGGTVLKANTWYHVGAEMTWARDTIKLYVNGDLDTMRVSAPMTGYPASTTDSVDMGMGYTGMLDDMRFYGEALSDQQVKAVYLQGFSPDCGMYSVRADNNGQIQCVMHGFNVTRILPVFQVNNYWSASLPSNVYIDTATLTNGTDYVASLDQGVRTLTVGFNRPITTNSTVYIGNTSVGQSMLTQMPQMDWAKTTVGGSDHVWVKNFSGNYFGTAAQKQFFFDWKMTNGNPTGANTKNGEMWFYASSINNPNARLDTTSNKNLIPQEGGSYNSDFGCITYCLNGHWPASMTNVAHSFTYSVPESSSVRVRVNIDKRVPLATDSFYVYTRWTIYPTGQIFRWDSVPFVSSSSNVNGVYYAFYLDSIQGGTQSATAATPKSKLRASVASTKVPDYVVALMKYRNSTGSVVQPFTNDTIATGIDAERIGFDFHDGTSANPVWNKVPDVTGFYIDLQSDALTTGHIDSIGCSVQHFPANALTILNSYGTLQKTTWGDINQDGFSEGEGAYVILATNNTVEFQLTGSAADTECRYNPAFRITGYYAPDVPQYVMMGSQAAPTVLAPLTPNYDYNVYLNKSAHELVVQIGKTICYNPYIYISYDRSLAVTMDRFSAYSGDRNDTLAWRTESEEQNLGFYLYRRIKPSFLDSLMKKGIAAPGTDTSAEAAGNSALFCLRKKLVTQADTNWVLVNINGLVAGAPQGKSYGPRNYRFIDYRVYNDIEYEYSLEAVDFKQSRSLYKYYANVMPQRIFPRVFDLAGNYPNPFRLMTMIRFALPVKTRVDLSVYNLSGRLVRKLIDHENRDAGFYRAVWDGKDDRGRTIASGPYIYRMTTPAFVKARVMVLAR